jgi:hypothetical protein
MSLATSIGQKVGCYETVLASVVSLFDHSIERPAELNPFYASTSILAKKSA